MGENEKKVLLAVGVGLLVLTSFALPNLPAAIGPILKMRGNKGFQSLLKKLRKKRLIDLGGEKIKLTAKGKKMLEDIELADLKLTKPEEWGGIWRLIAYDIPEKYKKSRDFFRYILEQNDFYQIQKSLWVHPYQCQQEIAAVAKNLNLSPYIIVMETEKLPNEKEMQSHFNLSED